MPFKVLVVGPRLIVQSSLSNCGLEVRGTMDRKRARFLENPWRDGSAQSEEVAAQRRQAGKILRLMLLERYFQGKMTAVDVTVFAFHITQCGGEGLEDLSLSPERESGHNEKLDHLVMREFPPPEVVHVPIPMYDSRTIRRCTVDMPMRLPSAILRASSENLPDEVLQVREASDPLADKLGMGFRQHAVTRALKARGVPDWQLRPLARYWDGVPFTKKDSFVAMYMHDMRLGRKDLVFLMRPAPKGASRGQKWEAQHEGGRSDLRV